MALKNEKNRIYWIGIYFIATVLLLLLHYFVETRFFNAIKEVNTRTLNFISKWLFTFAIISIILLIRTTLEKLISRLDQSQGDRYNLNRITRLIASMLIVYVTISSLFVNPYKSLAGLGLASLVLGFALQAPITSFISWLYIVFRRPYKVGDRIQINDHRGDVIEISYLDTIIEECSGDYLKNDRLSGRLIHFPNSKILTDRIINYSGPQAPFIWNETAVQIAYTSDLEYVEKCLKYAAEKDFENEYPSLSKESGEQWESAVYFRVNNHAWLEGVISYPVQPQDTTGRRNRILRIALPKLNEKPDKVQFPAGTAR